MPFKIFNYYIQHRDFQHLIQATWSSIAVYGTKMFQLNKRLKALKPLIRAMSRESYQGLHVKVEEERNILLQIQTELLTAPSVNLVHKEKSQLKLLQNLSGAEESLLLQKSRIKWLQEGDRNTSYFLRVVKTRQSRNSITIPTTANGEIFTASDAIKAEILHHYEGLLGSAEAPSPHIFQSLQSLLTTKLHDDEHPMLLADVTSEEVYSVVKGLLINKSPGPDGFTSKNFKSAWGTIRDLIVSAVQEFFISGQLLR